MPIKKNPNEFLEVLLIYFTKENKMMNATLRHNHSNSPSNNQRYIFDVIKDEEKIQNIINTIVIFIHA